MRTGKLSNEQLDRLILSKLKHTRNEVVCAPSVGVDCTAVYLERGLAVLSCDPITAAETGVGRLTVNVSCNDAAASGAEPIGLMITLLLPPSVTEEEVGAVMDEIIEAAGNANVDVIGGHTEITPAVNRIVTCATVIAQPVGEELITPKGVQPGDDIIVTKHVGLEGAMILADKLPEGQTEFTCEELREVRSFADSTSVVKEGIFAARNGAHAMHDVTEGGILGALWEMSTASDVGIEFDAERIPVREVTKKLCAHYGIDVYKLISSGCMLIAHERGYELCRKLSELGVEAAVIGKAFEKGRGGIVVSLEGQLVDPPEADEIYKV
ncbi:MAG: AIR synthase family protein [Clostridiales bacterium]|nr:AIR synthase family protein [Clostridiales bacterium]